MTLSPACITIDIDWAHDAVIRHTLDWVHGLGIRATWFATHATPILDEIRARGGHEIGIHPNFNPLLAGDPAGGGASAVLDGCMGFVPDARSVRAHSLAQSSRLRALYSDRGLTHDSDCYIPYQVTPAQRAWTEAGLVRVPFGWEDDVYLEEGEELCPQRLAATEGLVVLAFHPIHIFLNTDRMATYEQARPWFGDPARLAQMRRPDSERSPSRFVSAFVAAARMRDRPLGLIREIRP